MYWKPWTLTRPFWFGGGRGCDEHHNKSHFVILPLLGGFVFFWDRDFNRDGPEHIYAWDKFDGWEGTYHIDCEICNEIRVDHDQDLTERGYDATTVPPW